LTIGESVFAVVLLLMSVSRCFTLKSSRVKNAYFKVKLTETCALPLNALRNALTAKNEQLATSLEHVNRIMQCIDVIYKNHMNKVMVSSGRSPRMFHLTEDMHVTEEDRRGGRDYMNPVIGNNLRNVFYQVRDIFWVCAVRLVHRLTDSQLLFAFSHQDNSKEDFAPLVGLTQAARFCQDGNVFMTVDTSLGWFYRDKVFKSRPPPQPIRILDDSKFTLAGVKVGRFDQPITDAATQKAVTEAIRKLNFHVKFETPLTGSQWEVGM
jgi:hypothetical protein